MFNLKNIRTYNRAQIVTTVLQNIVVLGALYAALIKKDSLGNLYVFGLQIIIFIMALRFFSIFKSGKGEIYSGEQTKAGPVYLVGDKAKRLSFILGCVSSLLFLIFASFNTSVSDNIILNNLLAAVIGLGIFLPFYGYQDPSTALAD